MTRSERIASTLSQPAMPRPAVFYVIRKGLATPSLIQAAAAQVKINRESISLAPMREKAQ